MECLAILKLRNISSTAIKCLLFKKDVDINNVLIPNKISTGKITINNLLVTCIMIIKLSYCV